MQIDFEWLIGIVSCMIALAGTVTSIFFKLHKLISRFEFAEKRLQDFFDLNEPLRISNLEEKVESLIGRETRINQDAKIMLLGVRACLDGLHDQGCNGPVKDAREMLHRYIIESR